MSTWTILRRAGTESLSASKFGVITPGTLPGKLSSQERSKKNVLSQPHSVQSILSEYKAKIKANWAISKIYRLLTNYKAFEAANPSFGSLRINAFYDDLRRRRVRGEGACPNQKFEGVELAPPCFGALKCRRH